MFRCRPYVTIALLCFGLASFASVGSMPARAADPVLVGARDIAGCNSSGDEVTAALLDGIGGTVFTAGDNVYDAGTNSEFADCYEPS